MEEPQQKRPIFTPIVLLLLVISLIGNVFLASKQLQNGKDDRVDRGMAVLNSGNEMKVHIDNVSHSVRQLLDSGDAASRIAAKTSLQAAFSDGNSLVQFIDAANAESDKPLAFAKRNAMTFVSQIEQSTRAIGNHDGALTEAERAYLEQVESWYTEMGKAAASFEHDTVSEESALTILVDRQWKELARTLLDLMNKPEQTMYQTGG